MSEENYLELSEKMQFVKCMEAPKVIKNMKTTRHGTGYVVAEVRALIERGWSVEKAINKCLVPVELLYPVKKGDTSSRH